MRSIYFSGIVSLFVLFVACNNESDPPVKKDNTDNTPVELCDTLVATYDANVGAILNTSCAVSGCHRGVAPSAGINLSTYESAKAIAVLPKFLGAIKHEQGFVAMPYQRPKLEQKYIDILDCWVNKETPQN